MTCGADNPIFTVLSLKNVKSGTIEINYTVRLIQLTFTAGPTSMTVSASLSTKTTICNRPFYIHLQAGFEFNDRLKISMQLKE